MTSVLPNATSHHVDLGDGGGEVHYLDFGDPAAGAPGPSTTNAAAVDTSVMATRTPIVLVHGLGGSALNWLRIGPAPAQRTHVVALDLPGFGLSFPRGVPDSSVPKPMCSTRSSAVSLAAAPCSSATRWAGSCPCAKRA